MPNRGYSIKVKENPENVAEKCHPTSDKTVTMWEIHIPPPFPSIEEHNPTACSKHNIWTNTFKVMTFKSKNTAKGSVTTNLRFCFTCKALGHTYWMCPIHDHQVWHLQHPDEDKKDDDQGPTHNCRSPHNT